MADLPIVSRAIVYVRTAGGDELPVHGPGSAMPRAPFGDAVGDLQPEIFPTENLRPFQARQFAVVVHCPAPAPPMDHGTVPGQDSLLLGVRDLILEIFPPHAVCHAQQVALAHETTANCSQLLTSMPPSAAPGVTIPGPGAVTDVIVGYVSLTRARPFHADNGWSVYNADAPAEGRAKKILVDIGAVAEFGPGASLRVVPLGVAGRGSACPRRGVDPATERSHMLVRHVWRGAGVNRVLANCKTSAGHPLRARKRAAASMVNG